MRKFTLFTFLVIVGSGTITAYLGITLMPGEALTRSTMTANQLAQLFAASTGAGLLLGTVGTAVAFWKAAGNRPKFSKLAGSTSWAFFAGVGCASAYAMSETSGHSPYMHEIYGAIAVGLGMVALGALATYVILENYRMHERRILEIPDPAPETALAG